MSEYMSPCECNSCKAGKHCYYCLNGNPGSHYLFTTSEMQAAIPGLAPIVLAWFPTCFPQYRAGHRVIIPDEN